MESASGAHAVVFNGELFNAVEVAKVLQASGWRPKGRSDTEVLLAAVEAWGVEAALGRFVGMFAIALHDRVRRTLHLVRDRVGIKPLHWAWIAASTGRCLAFASEQRALLEVPGFDRAIRPAAASEMLLHGCVPGTSCIWSGVHKVAPGHRLEIDLVSGGVMEICWWNAADVAADAVAHPFTGSDAEAVARLNDLLEGVVREHLASDVPLGCLLSGGLDSAAVLAASRSGARGTTIEAFVAGFDDPHFDERMNARRTAATLATPLHECVVREAAMLDAVRRMPEVFDEPFADSSQLPTWVICREMRTQVTVALSGDGGDEVFGGYRRHAYAATGWPGQRRMPRRLRAAGAGAARSISADGWDALLRPVLGLLPARMRMRSPGASMHKWAECLGAVDEAEAYARLTRITSSTPESPSPWWRTDETARMPDFLRRMQLMDQTGYLVDDLLVKVDRASMAHGLEIRVPLLDHRLVQFAWTLPVRMKVRRGRGKWLLRRWLAQRLPSTVLGAPKTGFAAPLATWLRGPLREWAGDLLDSKWWQDEPALDRVRTQHAWRALQRGADAPQHELWCVLMYLAWSDRWRRPR